MGGGHVVGRQTLEIEVDSEQRALALQPHLHALNRRHLLPALEAVLDEFDRAEPGRHLRLARVEVDLGTLPAAGFEQELGPRLARSLRAALRRALDGDGREGGVQRRTRAQARRDLLEHYLVHGTLPLWAPREPAFDCETHVLALAQDDPGALAALLRRVGRHARVLERLAAQLREPALRRLAIVLEPRHGELVVAYVGSLRAVQHAERLVALGQTAFEQVVWCLAQAYLVRDPGTQFNRRSFLRSLVRGLAAREGLEYPRLLAVLQRALSHAGRRVALHASFPAVVAELVGEWERGDETRADALDEEHGDGARDERADISASPQVPDAPLDAGELQRLAAPYARLDRLRAYLRDGRWPWTTVTHEPDFDAARAGAEVAALSAAHLRALLRGSPAERRRRLARLVGLLRQDELETLVARLLPQVEQPGSPLGEALRASAAEARDRRAFFAAALQAALAGDDLDLEAWTRAPAPAAGERDEDDDEPQDPAAWDARRLRAALVARLHAGGAAGGDDTLTLEALLRALVERHPADTRVFMGALRRSPRLLAALVRQAPATLLARILSAVQPALAPALLVLREACERLPAPHRPRGDDTWLALLSAEPNPDAAPPEPRTCARILRSLLGATPSAALRGALARELRAAEARGAPAHVQVLREALGEDRDDRATAPRASHAAQPETGGHDGAPATDAQMQALLAWLGGESRAPHSPSDDALDAALDELLASAPERLRPFVQRHACDRRRREHWAASLSESVLARLAALIEPRRARALLSAAELLAGAWSEVAPPSHPALIGRAALWSFALEFLAETPAAERSLERLADAFCAHFASRYLAVAPSASDGEALGARLVERAGHLARAAGEARLAAVLERDRSNLSARFAGRLLSTRTPSRPPRAARPPAARSEGRAGARSALPNRSAFGLQGQSESQPTGEPIYVHNAGLVLVGAYLPHLFQALDLLGHGEDGRLRMRDADALSRGVHLLQFLVDGSTATPEPRLVLNKILCGASPETPVARAIEPTDGERELCERLLRSVIGNWTIISNTSVAGLQETFLRREGRLEPSPDGWRLTVQRKTLDVLVDQLPWSISVLLHGWMPQALYTRW